MKLTVDGLVEAIQSARRLEALQSELRNALIDRLIAASSIEVPTDAELPRSPHS
jgi:hypothetical protein